MIKILKNEINRVLQEISEISWDGKFVKITNDTIEDFAEEKYKPISLRPLIGYKVKCKAHGDHRNDGQIVDYTFTFKSPDGVETKLETDMCLVCGWDYHSDFEVK